MLRPTPFSGHSPSPRGQPKEQEPSAPGASCPTESLSVDPPDRMHLGESTDWRPSTWAANEDVAVGRYLLMRYEHALRTIVRFSAETKGPVSGAARRMATIAASALTSRSALSPPGGEPRTGMPPAAIDTK